MKIEIKKIICGLLAAALVGGGGFYIGQEAGYNSGYDMAYDKGHSAGYSAGYSAGVDYGKKEAGKAYNSGYNIGYSKGLEAVEEKNSSTSTEPPLLIIPERKPSTTVREEPKTITVYITETGEKYHRSGCQYLRQSSIAIGLSDAKNQGYTPCSRCNPPR